MRDSELLKLVKNELRNTRRYIRAFGEYSQHCYHLRVKQMHLKSPSLSSIGGTRSGQSNFDLLDYSEQIEIMEKLRNLYFQKVDWNLHLTNNAPIRTRNLIFTVYFNGMNYVEAQELFQLSDRMLRADMDSYLSENVTWEYLNKTLELTKRIENLRKKLNSIERLRGA